VAGLALLGVAVGAALVGVVSLGGGDGDNDAAPTSTTTPGDTPQSGDTGQPGTQPTSASETAPPATTPPPPATSASPAPPPPPPPAQPDPRAPVRVYNNGTIGGLAAQAADDFRRNGWVVEAVDNYSAGIIPTSTVYFQPDNEAAARALAQRFNLRVEPRFDGIAASRPGLIVIVTNDYGSK
jgi:hypothetical protein